MHETTLDSSTNRLGGSSGGALPSGSITLWNLSAPEDVTESAGLPNRLCFEWNRADAGLTRTRVACHLLMEFIPDRGLSELCESLAEMYEFYSFEPSTPLLPSHQSIAGTVGQTYQRPEFQIDLE